MRPATNTTNYTYSITGLYLFTSLFFYIILYIIYLSFKQLSSLSLSSIFILSSTSILLERTKQENKKENGGNEDKHAGFSTLVCYIYSFAFSKFRHFFYHVWRSKALLLTWSKFRKTPFRFFFFFLIFV